MEISYQRTDWIVASVDDDDSGAIGLPIVVLAATFVEFVEHVQQTQFKTLGYPLADALHVTCTV